MNRETAWNIVQEFVKDAGLRRHMLAVEAAMRFYGDKLGQDADRFALAGLLHDFDWEIHPTIQQHPAQGAPILRERDLDEDLVRTILSHNSEGSGVEPEKPIDFVLQACDEITGLLIACVLVRPSKDIREMTIKSVKKKWKDRAFAAGVKRDEVEQTVTAFSQQCFGGQLGLWDHAQNVLEAMQGAAEMLELDGRLAGSAPTTS